MTISVVVCERFPWAACVFLGCRADDFDDMSTEPSSPKAARTSPGQGRTQNPNKREGAADPTRSEEPVTPRGRDTPQGSRSLKRKARGSGAEGLVCLPSWLGIHTLLNDLQGIMLFAYWLTLFITETLSYSEQIGSAPLCL